jgi:hypothetical protein
LHDLVVRIDAPLLDNLNVSIFNETIHDTAQLALFINRTPKLKAYNEAHVVFYPDRVHLTLRRAIEKGPGISLEVADWQVSSVAQICTSSLSQACSATVEHLYIDNYGRWRGDIRVENNHWLELLRPFTVPL